MDITGHIPEFNQPNYLQREPLAPAFKPSLRELSEPRMHPQTFTEAPPLAIRTAFQTELQETNWTAPAFWDTATISQPQTGTPRPAEQKRHSGLWDSLHTLMISLLKPAPPKPASSRPEPSLSLDSLDTSPRTAADPQQFLEFSYTNDPEARKKIDELNFSISTFTDAYPKMEISDTNKALIQAAFIDVVQGTSDVEKGIKMIKSILQEH